MPNIYMGKNSCYATKEGMYVAPGPMDLAHAAAHLYLHLRDLRRGWTYDHDCKRVSMDYELFKARSRYLVKICRDQGNDDCDDVERLVEEVIRTLRLPKWAEELALRHIVKLSSITQFFL